jgi:hypothetical protein
VATSNTTTYNPSTVDIVEEACSLAGFEPRTGFDFRQARSALNLLISEWANRGLNMWAITSTSTTLVASTATVTLATDCVDVLEAVIRTDAGSASLQTDLRIHRISASTYSTIPNKLSTGRPLQYLVNRTLTPTMTLWPVPDDSQTWTLFYYYIRRIQDAGTRADLTLDIPFRFYNAMVAGLAYQMAMRKPELAPRVPFLKSYYDEQYELASQEDREKAPVRLVPYIA